MKYTGSLKVLTMCIVILLFHNTVCKAIIKKEKAEKPNIILFISDDHGYDDTGVYGNKVIKTPNIDGLAKEGLTFLNAFAAQNLEPQVVFTARDADVIKTYVRMGMGVGVIAPMALLCDDLNDLNASCAKGHFPTVTTWLGFPRDKVLRQYMKDFIAMFAPHWPEHLIEQAATAESQDIVDHLAADLDLPTRTGCTKGLAVAA